MSDQAQTHDQFDEQFTSEAVAKTVRYEALPGGSYIAKRVALVGLGTHKRTDDKTGKEYSNRVLLIAFEVLCNSKFVPVKRVDGTPVIMGFDITWPELGLSPDANLWKLLEKWNECTFNVGDKLPLRNLTDSPVALAIQVGKSAKGTEYNKLDWKGVQASILPPGFVLPATQTEPFFYVPTPGCPKIQLPTWLPFVFGDQRIMPANDKLAASIEYGGDGRTYKDSGASVKTTPPPSDAPDSPAGVSPAQAPLGEPGTSGTPF